ncbi:MiaB/RimO family radical SAM methylthiotransferase [Candidatus Gracilibacteria bacterium]|nr:MiaB/RimO family radical SAM methylthiotransferase [Candidatus Gracilibacteria bacterium]
MGNKLKTYSIKTFGCAMNFSDSEKISSVLDSYGLTEVLDDENADLVIFNTCSIKQKSEDKIFGLLHNFKKIKEKFPHRKYGITGCMVKKSGIRDKESVFYSNDPLLRRSEILDFVFRILDLPKLPGILGINKNSDKNLNEDKEKFFQIQQKLKSPHQAIIPIQTGCDNFCTYCVVPYTRGKEFSRSIAEITREINFYAKKGIKEVILVGQNVNSYGKGGGITKRKFDEENKKWLDGEEKTPFAKLLEEVNKIEGIERIRFQSSNPHDMTNDIIKAILNCEKVMPSLHFALQSGNDEILKKMRRRHTFDDFKKIVKKLRSKNKKFGISTDIIVGFCGETEGQFQNTLKAIREIQFDMIYISQYSVRKGTFAGDKMNDDISLEIKKKRWQETNEELKKSMKNRMSIFQGEKVKVLIDKIENGICEGKTEENYVCRFSEKNYKVGEIVEVEVIGSDTWALKGE